MRSIVFACFLSVITSVGMAQPVEEARDAYRAGNFELAFVLASAAADQGDPVAQNLLGVLFLHGDGVPRDVDRAVGYFRDAIAGGNVLAMANIGDAFLDGAEGLEINPEEVFDLLETAAAAGNAGAQNGLGLFYHRGVLADPDYARAMEYYLMAYEGGDMDAATNIGLLVLRGQGVQQDYDIARQWFELAAEGGLVRAMEDLANMYRRGVGVPQDGNRAIEIYQQAAEAGSVLGPYWIGWIYENGVPGVARDIDQAIYYYEQSSLLGDDYAPLNLGWIYEFNQSGSPDFARAFGYYQLALERGNTEAYYELARLYWDGNGVNIDLAEARELMELGADAGWPIAMNDLGIMRWDGIAGPVDYVGAESAFLNAIAEGYALSAMNLSDLLASEENPAQNIVHAYAYCLLAIDINDVPDDQPIFERDCAARAATMSADQISEATTLRQRL